MKKWIELIESNHEKILAELEAAEDSAYRFPDCEYRVYIDTDGETGREEWPAKDCGWYEFRGDYARCYIHTFCYQYFDVLWDLWFDDLNIAREAFESRFGFPVEQDEDSYKTPEQEMRDTVLSHGGSNADLDAWLEEMRSDAITELTADAEFNYNAIIRDRINELSDYGFT